MTHPLRVGALFAGYGGIELALGDLLDVELVWYAEVDPGACLILAHRFPGVPNLGDVTKIDWATVPPVDILTGGSPCQDLSNAGGRLGMTEGTRSNLWVAMREAIAVLRPDLVIWENVRGAYSAEATSDLERDSRLLADVRRQPGQPALRALGRVLGDLSALRFDAEWRGLPASAVGAPHERLRVFVAAYPSERGCTIRPRRPRLPILTRRTPLLPTPRTTDSHGPGVHGTGGQDLRTVISLLPTPLARDYRTGYRAGRAAPGRRGPAPLNDVIEDTAQWGKYAVAIDGWGRLTRPAPAPRESTPLGRARLSAVFVEWMMGLPEGWVTDVAPTLTHKQAVRALGNGVVPPQAAAAIYDMLAAAAR